MTAFDTAFEKTIVVEGGYSNHPDDSGGETKYGITEAVAREEGYSGPMAEMSLETAKEIYRHHFWEKLRLEEIATISSLVAQELFDSCVHLGSRTPMKFLQRTLNVFNNKQADYADITADGVIGPKTIAALKAFWEKRKDEVVLLKSLNSLQGAHYIGLAESREKDEAFVYGWMKNRL